MDSHEILNRSRGIKLTWRYFTSLHMISPASHSKVIFQMMSVNTLMNPTNKSEMIENIYLQLTGKFYKCKYFLTEFW